MARRLAEAESQVRMLQAQLKAASAAAAAATEAAAAATAAKQIVTNPTALPIDASRQTIQAPAVQRRSVATQTQ